MKKFTRDRVVPTISASVSWEIGGTALTGFVVLAVPRQQQERPRQPFLTGVEQLVDQVLLDPDVPRQHVRDEPIRQRVLLVQQRAPSDPCPRGGWCCPLSRSHSPCGRVDPPGILRQRTRPGPASPRRPLGPPSRAPRASRHPSGCTGRCSHGSPWVKMTSARRYSTIFLAIPAESRNAWALNVPFCFDSITTPLENRVTDGLARPTLMDGGREKAGRATCASTESNKLSLSARTRPRRSLPERCLNQLTLLYAQPATPEYGKGCAKLNS